MNLILQIIYFLLPAALANMMPVFMKNKMPYLNKPLDFNFKLGKNRILGDNKTFRGLVSGIIGAVIIVYIQLILYDFKLFRDLSLINYSTINFLVFGFLIGFGVIFGDAIGSFIKRRFNIIPGKSLLLIDQINGIIGLAVFVYLFYLASLKIYFYSLIIWILGHFLFKFIGYLLKIDKEAI